MRPLYPYLCAAVFGCFAIACGSEGTEIEGNDTPAQAPDRVTTEPGRAVESPSATTRAAAQSAESPSASVPAATSESGNNGVGNGQDPAPPGAPPENDGTGTEPGKPGNRP